jgi:hypothetical protein
MSLQTIINSSTNIQIMRPRMTAQQVTRSGRLISNTVDTARPWRFHVTYRPAKRYAEARGMLEDLDFLDRSYTQDIDIGSTNPKLSYITGYQGDNPDASLTLQSTNNYSREITVSYTGANNGGILLKKGDYIQPGQTSGYPYVYTVTGDVTANSSSGTVTVPIHRNFIPYNYPEEATFIGRPIAVGTQCRFRVQIISRPNAQVQVDQFLGFESEFVLQEVIV